MQVDLKGDVWEAEENHEREWEKRWIIDLRHGFLFLDMDLTDVKRESMQNCDGERWTAQQRVITQDMVAQKVSEGGRGKSDILYLNIMFFSNYTQNCVFIPFELQTYYTWEKQAFRRKITGWFLLHLHKEKNTTSRNHLFVLWKGDL
jgi:hypothetical protein